MNKEDKLIEQLVKIYTEALDKLQKKITSKATLGRATAYERSLYRQVKEELEKLKKSSSKAVKKLVQHSYKKGLDSLLKDIEGVEKRSYNLFSGLNIRQIELIADNLTRDLNNAINLIGRRYDDLIRRVTLETTAKKLSQGQTIRQMQKQLAEELQKNNINYVEYADGKRHGIKDYANMAARSTTAEAQNKAKIVQGEDWGYDLVRMTKHYPTCEICAMYQDRVYALTKEAANGKYKDKNGKPLKFPYLYDTAFADGYDTIHPNCRHRISIFPARAYTLDELAEFSRRSMQPFEDTRPDNERKAYAAEQATKRKRNASYRQYQDVKAHLPNDAPKTFAGWQRMKQTNSQRYQDLMADYRYVKKSVATSGDGGIIELQRNFDRKERNEGAFSNLKIPMQKRYVLNICEKYQIDTRGLTIKIQRSEKLLKLPLYGSTDYQNIGRIDLFPNAFIDEEQLVKTILHEKCHVKQLQKYGSKYVQDNLSIMERTAYRFEKVFYGIVTRRAN